MIKTINGTKITDAKRAMLLEIEKQDIASARPQEPNMCPIARAIKRALKANDVHVHLSRVYVQPEPKMSYTRYFVPQALRAEIVTFDRGGGFEPGHFILKPISVHMKAGYRRKSNGEDKGYRKRKRHTLENVRPWAGA
jgi:hypothetical protein